MSNTIDMQIMRYINLFERISHVSTSNCFVYNNTIYFAVPKHLVMRAVGKNGENVKEMANVLRRKIKIIALPNKENYEKSDDKTKEEILKSVVEEIVAPIEISSLKFIDGVITISGTREAKAILIGRDRNREKQLAEVLKRNFDIKEFHII